MSKLSKFIFKKWLKYFLIIFMAMFFMGALGDFISFALKDKYGTSEMFWNLFLKTSIIIEKILPICCLFSSLFLFINLKNHSELTAILSGSFPKKKIAQILFLGGIITFGIQLFNRGYYETFLYDLSIKDNKKNSFKFKKKVTKDGTIWFKGNEYFGSFLFFDEKENKIINPKLFMTKEKVVDKIIQGDYAIIDENRTWNFHNAKILKNLSGATFPVAENLGSYSTTLDRAAGDFQKYQAGIYSLGLISLKGFIDNMKEAGINVRSYFILYYEKIASAIACLLFTIFPIFTIHNVGKRSSSIMGGLFLTLIFTLSFWFMAGALISIGESYNLSALLSVFTLHIIMALFCLYHYFKLEKLV